MKYVDVASLFRGEPASLALLSTFQFDPDFFERKLLRSDALSKARRIAVFMDSREWRRLLRRDSPARWLNRRYLVVPVTKSGGVFHPKLTVMLRDSDAQILIGSNNLTRSGCSSNLELLNAAPCRIEPKGTFPSRTAREALGFFRQAAGASEPGASEIVSNWLDEAVATTSWLSPTHVTEANSGPELLHNFGSSLWSQLKQRWQRDQPREFLIISPYHDADAHLCRRLTAEWPAAKVELLVQSQVTRLSAPHVKKLKNVVLAELVGVKRRLHAKLLAWRGKHHSGCLVGSANFTRAAFDGANVEACLLIGETDDLVRALFDGTLSKRSIAWDKFEPAEWDDDESEPDDDLALRIRSAVLSSSDKLVVSYVQNLSGPARSLRLAVQVPGESQPRAQFNMVPKREATERVTLPNGAFNDVHSGIVVSLIAETSAGRLESAPVWIVQEDRLTYEPSGSTSASRRAIEDTGEGLPAFLEELGARDGINAVIEFLQNLSIRFNDGEGGGVGGRSFRVRIRDPFRSDAAPAWLINHTGQHQDLEKAILDFVDRHIDGRLRKHARRGNINGMPNFVDIFRTLSDVLVRYWRRGIVKGGKVLGKLCTLLEVAAVGRQVDEDEFHKGYLPAVYDNLAGDAGLIAEACREWGTGAQLRAALLIAQTIRFDPKEPAIDGQRPTRPREVLPTLAGGVRRALSRCEPTPDDVRGVLVAYGAFEMTEIDALLLELPPVAQSGLTESR